MQSLSNRFDFKNAMQKQLKRTMIFDDGPNKIHTTILYRHFGQRKDRRIAGLYMFLLSLEVIDGVIVGNIFDDLS